MNRSFGLSPDDMTKLVMAYVNAARMYNRLMWKSKTEAERDTWARHMGENMGKAKWWRKQLKEVYGI